ncbi:hypothetical protein ccbrp13_40200 [Ktedonobacteria bacterium brp13]|nr:hypothetical protein ccbrp13_40200 [Ktedonobacteria bacterium brp13]
MGQRVMLKIEQTLEDERQETVAATAHPFVVSIYTPLFTAHMTYILCFRQYIFSPFTDTCRSATKLQIDNSRDK